MLTFEDFFGELQLAVEERRVLQYDPYHRTFLWGTKLLSDCPSNMKMLDHVDPAPVARGQKPKPLDLVEIREDLEWCWEEIQNLSTKLVKDGEIFIEEEMVLVTWENVTIEDIDGKVEVQFPASWIKRDQILSISKSNEDTLNAMRAKNKGLTEQQFASEMAEDIVARIRGQNSWQHQCVKAD